MELGNMIWGNSRGKYPIERYPAQDYFGAFFEVAGLDYHGHPDITSPLYQYSNDKGMIDTELFSIFPYYYGDDEEIMQLPNFVYKPDNVQIQWYKYPLRDAYSNIELCATDIQRILLECIYFVGHLQENCSSCKYCKPIVQWNYKELESGEEKWRHKCDGYACVAFPEEVIHMVADPSNGMCEMFLPNGGKEWKN